MANKKRQHFVPQCYLKSWTIKDELCTLSKQNGIPRKQTTKTIAKRDNLYTIPSTFFENREPKNRDLQELITENVIFKIWEDRCAAVTDIATKNGNFTSVLHTIKGFVIAQSFRTPKFIRSNKEKIERMGKSSENIDDVYHFAISGIKGLTDYILNCVCEILRCNDISNFITSDNPSTHWLQQGDIFHHLNGIALNNDLYKNPNYKILCPIHPKYFAILTPNLGIDVPETFKNQVVLRTIYNDTVKQLNKMIEHGADKMLFAKTLNDFV